MRKCIFSIVIAFAVVVTARAAEVSAVSDQLRGQREVGLILMPIAMDTAALQTHTWLLGGKGYAGKDGIAKLAKATQENRTKVMDELKAQIDYHRGSPEVVGLLKDAMAIAIEFFDSIGPETAGESLAHYEARINDTKQRFNQKLARIKVELELAK